MGFFKFNKKEENKEQTSKVFGEFNTNEEKVENTVTEETTNVTINNSENNVCEFGSPVTVDENIKQNAETNKDDKKWKLKGEGSNLPTQVTKWSKIKSVLLKEIDIDREIVLELTPGEQRFINNMKNFWLKEIKLSELFRGKKAKNND